MGIICACPKGAYLADITVTGCDEAFGQLQKVVFQRVNSTGSTKNSLADPTLLASWTPLLAAVNGTKAVSSPYLQAPALEAGAARTFGGGNDTLGGIERITGREAASFTGSIYDAAQITIKDLKAYQCEGVAVWMVDEFGRIGCLVDDRDAPTAYFPIPIFSLFIGDKVLGGLESPDTNAVMWKQYPNWSDNFVIVTPSDFNALTDLIPPA